jgi:serine/threonine protein phosphatase PrpC
MPSGPVQVVWTRVQVPCAPALTPFPHRKMLDTSRYERPVRTHPIGGPPVVAPQLTLRTAMRSVTGPHRTSNQDSLGSSRGYMFVADGVGGSVGGDVASWIVTHRVMACIAPGSAALGDDDELRTVIALANADLALRVRDDPGLRGMATTFTGVFCNGSHVLVAHIGDSRAYLVRDGRGRRVTTDDSLVQRLVDSGVIEADAAMHHPQRNIILQSLGGSPDDVEGLTVLTEEARVGDRWLVTSDGLTDYVEEAELVSLLGAAATPEAAVESLVAAALAADTHDNVSVAVSDVVPATGAKGRAHRYLGAAAASGLPATGDLSDRPSPRPASGRPAGSTR